MKTFQEWLIENHPECIEEMCGATGTIFDAKAKLKTANWEGAPGSTGKVIEGEPIKQSWKKKKNGK